MTFPGEKYLVIACLVFSTTGFAWGEYLPGESSEPDQTRLILSYGSDGINQRGLFGYSQAPKHEAQKNVGYLGIEHRTWNAWQLNRVGLFIDSFHNPAQNRQGGLKLQVYFYHEAATDYDFEQMGLGVAVQPVFQPLKNLFFSPGVTMHPFFTTFDWQQPYVLIHQWQFEFDWFLGNHLAVTSGFYSLSGYNEFFLGTTFEQGWWGGIRVQF